MNGIIGTEGATRCVSNSSTLLCRKSQSHLANIQQQIVSNYANSEYSLVALAESLQLSRRYIQRILAQNHLTFSALLGQIRLAVAAERLVYMDQNKRLSELAAECGFKTQSSFNRAFKVRYAMTPRAYRTERLRKMKDA